jgi:hypothetical protein
MSDSGGRDVRQLYRGLDLTQPDVTSAAELKTFFDHSDQPGGRPLASYDLFASVRPDVLKRGLAFSREIHASEQFKCSLPYLNIYAIGGWCEGVKYQIELLQPGTFITDVGFTRDAIVETLALSFYLAPAWGTVQTADTARQCLESFRDPQPDAPSAFPKGWRIAPEELKAGLDYSKPDLTKADLDALTEWYLRVCGEVPASVRLYAKYRPTLLKAERNRWENIVKTGLPNIMFAYLLLHYEVWRGNIQGTRDALLLARGLGMSKDIAVGAIWYAASFFGGLGTLSAVADPVEEALANW